MRDTILIAVIQELSSVKYCYKSYIRGCIKYFLQQHNLPDDTLSAEDYEYIIKRAIEVFNSLEETVSVDFRKTERRDDSSKM